MKSNCAKSIVVLIMIAILAGTLFGCSSTSKLSVEDKINISDAAWNEMYDGVYAIGQASGNIDAFWQHGARYGGKKDTTAVSTCYGLGIYDTDTIIAISSGMNDYNGLSVSQIVQMGVNYNEMCGFYDEAEEHIQAAQDIFKDLERDSRLYELFRDYSIAASSYLQYLESPTGSYSDFSSKTNDFADAISEYGNSLAFEMKNIE